MELDSNREREREIKHELLLCWCAKKSACNLGEHCSSLFFFFISTCVSNTFWCLHDLSLKAEIPIIEVQFPHKRFHIHTHTIEYCEVVKMNRQIIAHYNCYSPIGIVPCTSYTHLIFIYFLSSFFRGEANLVSNCFFFLFFSSFTYGLHCIRLLQHYPLNWWQFMLFKCNVMSSSCFCIIIHFAAIMGKVNSKRSGSLELASLLFDEIEIHTLHMYEPCRGKRISVKNDDK